MGDTEKIAAFLRDAGWAGAATLPIAGDASARKFARLSKRGNSAVLMDASSDGAGSSMRFAEMSAWLRERGFSAPVVLASDLAGELLLVEDFGDAVFARLLEDTPSRETEIYITTAEFLSQFQRHAPPRNLPHLDGPALGQLTALVFDWYIPGMGGQRQSPATHIPDLIAGLYDRLAGEAPLVTSLRDFHAENVIWLPSRRGVARLGLLDFQDAVAAHPAYDLVSFLQDARRDLRPATEADTIDLYCKLTGRDTASFAPIYALIGAQRALRILGVFARLILRSGKPRYAQFMPRVWRHLSASLRHPALSDLADAVRGAVPEPTPDRIERLVAECPTA
jgi:aminoglycoside/choline kinase family phosphotransferase